MPTKTPRESFSFADSARLLGVSRWTVSRLVHRGKLAAFHVEGRHGKLMPRIHVAELRRYKRDSAMAADG